MCLLPQCEQFQEMDDMAEWGSTHVRQPVAKVTNIPPNPRHELAPHFDAEPKRSMHWGSAILFAATSLAAYAGLIAICQGAGL